MNLTRKTSASKSTPLATARKALASKQKTERLDRITARASELVALAESMPGDSEANIRAVCTAAICEALDGVARSRS